MVKRSTRSSKRRVSAAAAESSDINIDDNNKKDTTNEKYDDGSVEHQSSITNGTKELTTAEELNSSSNNNMTKLEELFHNLQTSLSSNLLPIISQPEELLATLLNETSDNTNGSDKSTAEQQKHQQQSLIQTTKLLFQYIENMSSIEEQLKELDKKKSTNSTSASEEEEEENTIEDPCTLSGIPTIYTTTEGVVVDAETIWGQVDLQNEALIPRIKKLIKKLAKRTTNENNKYDDEELVRILDMNGMNDESDSVEGSDSDEDDSEEGEMMSMGSAASDFGEEEGPSGNNNIDSDEDSDARRVRIRMEKAMADMDNSEDDDDESATNLDGADEEEKKQKLKQLTTSAALLEEEEGIIDQTREDMRDGFFDLHEMEAFADEEEEMLPDVAYGDIPIDKGNDDNDDSEEEGFGDEDEEEEDPLSKRYEPTTIRRKKYRADDEVDALCKFFFICLFFVMCQTFTYIYLYHLLNFDFSITDKLYEEEQDTNGFGESDDDDDEDNEGGVDASTMSAADFFGKPNKKLIQSYKAKHDGKNKKNGKKKDGANTKATKKTTFEDDDDDADSWDEHNFEEDGMDWKGGGVEEEDDSEEEGENGDEDQLDNEDEEDEEEEIEMKEEDNQKLSAHALQAKKLKEQTLRLEHDLISEKPWKMLGEAKGSDRAQDSLLDSTPEFEVAFKPPPILTAEHTTDIEEMIKRRIIDEDYDDVIPRELPDIGAHKRGGEALEVSQEKSKLGLGELYEREYLKKTTGFDRSAHEKQTEEDEAKEEMKQLFANLCSQLDALSNYHFAPRPVADEADVQNREDVPAIAMEEVLPLHVSQSRGMAPEEVYGTGKGKQSVLKGESELDQVSSVLSCAHFNTVLSCQLILPSLDHH